MTDYTVPDFLLDYLAQRDAARRNAAAEAFTALTNRERSLVHDAAVMGYIQGMRHPREQRIPKDHLITGLVMHECLAFPDLYPTLTGYVPEPVCAGCGRTEDEHEQDRGQHEFRAEGASNGGDHV